MKNIVVSLISGLIGAMIFIVAHNAFYSKSIAVLRMDEILASHIQEFSKKKMTEKEREVVTSLFAETLQNSLDQIEKEDNVIILVDPAVISDVPDYTETVKSKIKHILEVKKLGRE